MSNIYKTDFTFGENLSEPLNIYFTHHISEIIDTMVFCGMEDEEYHKKCLINDNFLLKELTNKALTYIERKFDYISIRAFNIMFDDTNLLPYVRSIYVNLYELKNLMINFE